MIRIFPQVPIDDQLVTITKPILLDTATARLAGVDIRDGGRLVFSPGNTFSQYLLNLTPLLPYASTIPDSGEAIAMTTRYVLIGAGGRMDIGGPEDECRLELLLINLS